MILSLFHFYSHFSSRSPQTPVKFSGRLKNIALVHYRGLLGVLVPLFLLSWQGEKGKVIVSLNVTVNHVRGFFLGHSFFIMTR